METEPSGYEFDLALFNHEGGFMDYMMEMGKFFT